MSDERKIGERPTLSGLPGGGMGGARLLHRLKIDLHRLQHVGNVFPGEGHLLGGAFADSAQQYSLAIARGLRRLALVEIGEDVASGDSSRRPRFRNFGRVAITV